MVVMTGAAFIGTTAVLEACGWALLEFRVQTIMARLCNTVGPRQSPPYSRACASSSRARRRWSSARRPSSSSSR
jgi:hypothetical protein